MKMRKSWLIAALLLTFIAPCKASDPDEGMWIPLLLGELNEADMKARGLRLTADDIYSLNKTSLKDAVISFGGFCTGELVSNEGLLFTNHHCGFGAIQTHSSTESNLINNGFWAMSKKEELPNAGLTATFIVRIEDVTAKVLKGVTASMNEGERMTTIAANMTAAKEEAVKGTAYKADIKAFFYGNEYYLFVTETFRDVRLVGAPPVSIGNFGGDADNWVWPRHTGDFSIFRIYAGPDNKPADYSENNVPYKPKHFFPISIKGVKEGDYTMVYGFPGRTTEYLSSFAVEQQLNLINPARISLRREVLDIMQADMEKSEQVNIQYASKEAQISNYWKKWSGESHGLVKAHTLERKQEMERKFTQWLGENRTRADKYGTVLNELKAGYEKLAPLARFRDYVNECIFRAEILEAAWNWEALIEESKDPASTDEDIKKTIDNLRTAGAELFKDFNAPTDQKLLAKMIQRFENDVPNEMQPAIIQEINSKYAGNWNQYAADVFAKSIFSSQAKSEAFLAKYKRNAYKKIEADPAYQLISAVMHYYLAEVKDQAVAAQAEIDRLNRTYMAAQREMLTDKKFYPDANGTLRVTFGQVDDYEPRDGVHYNWYTTLDGIMEKYIAKDVNYDAPDKLLELYRAKDFGRYAENGVMHVCFTASNHTTGGNSGSPVLDADGNLIGTNFDRNWEGTMSDLQYDPNQCRNISVDVRYTLFIIDKFAGAGYLLNEMKILE
jgi:Peptidase S46